MKSTYNTERLILRELSKNDASFIEELLNSSGWLQFIGDRNIKSKTDAEFYIKRIQSDSNMDYRVIVLRNTQQAIGVVSLVKRSYLNHPDIGFALLPAFSKKGYAFEATYVVLHDLLQSGKHKTLYAFTVNNNIDSIKLLKKLGFNFSEEMIQQGELLQVFAIHTTM